MNIRVFHSSDWHLSFTEDGSIQKPMADKTWAKGSVAYTGYLDRLIKDGEVISDNDFLVITGDLTHDMPATKFINSIRWIRKNFKGNIVIIRGNHDKKWKIRKARLEAGDLHNIHFIDEGEIVSIGDYTFGCYSYLFKEGEGPDRDYPYKKDIVLDLAAKTVKHARSIGSIPVFLSHFPAPRDIAEEIGN